MNSQHNVQFSTSWKAVVLLAVTMYPVSFLHVLFHEVGHALMAFAYGESGIQLFIHPFAFSCYARPIVTLDNGLYHLAGPLAGLLIPLVIFLIARRWRSPRSLFLVMLFPWSLLWEGLNMLAILTNTGDFYNLAMLTGIPTMLFAVIGIALMLAGTLMIDSRLPLAGIKPDNYNSLWVVPLSVILWSLPSFLVACWLIPKSDFVIQWQLQEEIQTVARMWLFLMAAIGLLLGSAHVTLYRLLDRRFKKKRKQSIITIRWRDMVLPTVWGVLSVAVGLVWVLW